MEYYKKTKRGRLRLHGSAGDKDDEKLDRYLITYSDLITLLLGLFVILYSTGQVDESKFKMFSAAFADYFSIKDSSKMRGGGSKIFEGENGLPQPILPKGPKKTIEQINQEMNEAFRPLLEKGQISIARTDGELKLRLPELMLFKSAKAEIQAEAEPILDSLAKILNGLSQTITIDGHTDGVPIKTFQYESNWHLSAARALNILYSLVSKGVQEDNISMRAYGPLKPIADNSTEEGRAKNRRVEIVIFDPTAVTPSKEGMIAKDSIIN